MLPLPWYRPHITGAEAPAMQAVIESGFINDGPQTKAFEEAIADFIGVEYAVAVTSGTAAITLALMASSIPPGSEVIVPDLTFIATANAVQLAGLVPVLADVDPTRFCLTVDSIEEARTPNTAAVVAVEVNGRSPDYKAMEAYCDKYDLIEAYCAKYGLVLITDSCEALGSAYNGRKLGSYGAAGCLSFSPNKIITTGQGGMVLTKDRRIANRVLELKDQGRLHRGTGGDDLHPTRGYNFKFTDLQAAFGLAQFGTIHTRIATIKKRNKLYSELLGVTLPNAAGELSLWFDVLTEKRYELADQINIRNFWLPLHTQGPYITKRKFPNADRISRLGAWLPSSLDLSQSDIEQVCAIVRKCHGRISNPSRAA